MRCEAEAAIVDGGLFCFSFAQARGLYSILYAATTPILPSPPNISTAKIISTRHQLGYEPGSRHRRYAKPTKNPEAKPRGSCYHTQLQEFSILAY
ncbi:MAG: hypothetical protein HLUCCO03_08910 [Marinobacter sp. HL-58]|nr:MAG: hypothetical protein HLUCCO03_08910 [Marinobacter sp. HL-58]